MWLTLIKAVLVLLPMLVQAIRDGRIKEGAKDEVLREIATVHGRHVDAAAAARDAVDPDRLRDGGRNPNQRD